jgi:hypothetical protein
MKGARGPVAAVCAAVGLLAAMSVAAPAQAMAGPPNTGYGGYVVIPDALHSAVLDLTVPVVRCAADLGAYRAEVGLSGHERQAGRVQAWSLRIRLSCDAEGTLTTRGVMTQDGSSAVLRVGVGDRIKLATSGATLSIEDLTKGSGMGGASGPGIVMVPTISFGARTTVTLPDLLRVPATRARVNTVLISTLAHHRQVQDLDGAIVAVATRLAADGTFTFRVQ